jgi:hypothetical protein
MVVVQSTHIRDSLHGGAIGSRHRCRARVGCRGCTIVHGGLRGLECLQHPIKR